MKHLDDPSARGSRAEEFLIRYRQHALPMLTAATDNENPVVRYRAVYALGKIGDKRAVPGIRKLADDSDERVRYDAIIVLGFVKHQDAVDALRSIFKIWPVESVERSACLMALQRLDVIDRSDDEDSVSEPITWTLPTG